MFFIGDSAIKLIPTTIITAAIGSDSTYKYIVTLMSLNTLNRGATDTSYNTPLNLGSWAHSLCNHSDKDYVKYYQTGLPDWSERPFPS